jgi:glucokinase
MKALAMDLGGRHVSCALVEDDHLLAEVSLPMKEQPLAAVLTEAGQAFRQMCVSQGVRLEDCAGLAFGFCGLVDSRANRVLSTNQKYDEASQFDFDGWARSTLGMRMRMENDARLALLGEWYAGAARGASEVVMMTLGTGVGGAAMMEGRLIRGKHFQAGCLGGHIPVKWDGRPCSCGGRGCVEAEASTWALPEVCRQFPGFASSQLARLEEIDFLHLFKLADEGDRVARGALDQCLAVWAAGLVALIHAYDPELIVVGGGVMRRAESILPALESHIHLHSWTPWGKVVLRAAERGSQAALLGAVPLLSEDCS